jgi:hypothetical protein
MRGLTLLLITSFFAAHLSKGVVCSEDELIRELREDITDNGTPLILRSTGLFFRKCEHLRCGRNGRHAPGETQSQLGQ